MMLYNHFACRIQSLLLIGKAPQVIYIDLITFVFLEKV